MKLKIIIVEDEYSILMDLSRKIQKLGHEVVGTCSNYDETILTLVKEKPDLVIADINLNEQKTGVDLGRIINEQFKIPFIFLTASSDKETFDYALTVNPMGFIVKPFKIEDLRNNIDLAIIRYQEKTEKKGQSDIKFTADGFFVKNNGQFVQVSVTELSYLEAMDNYTKVHVDTEKYLVNISLKEMCDKLEDYHIKRIHKSFAVSIKQIKSIEGNKIKLRNSSTELPIGKTYKDDLMDSINLLF